MGMADRNGDTPRELFLIDGNSLAYRAFFALPESIATSDGRPTNAIFGFASMLVKILTDYGEVPTVVVWDAGLSGRKELSADYKAQRSSRPDLLKLQWPHLRPLVEAFGYRNISVEGFEADDVIAALVQQAKEREIPVMVVTGDRDAYQLVGDGVRIMTTSRGITDTKVYDRDGRHRPLRHPARADPRLHRPQGRHERQHPRRPRHRRQDRLASCCSASATSRPCSPASTRSPAPSASRTSPSTPTPRGSPSSSPRSSTTSRSSSTSRPRSPARPTAPDLREIFREWELRDPLRRLEEALEDAEIEAIPRPEQPTPAPSPCAGAARRRRHARRRAARARRARRPRSPRAS